MPPTHSSSPSRARVGPANYRCPCHAILFCSKEEYENHMHPVAFPSVGAPDFHQWIDNLDTHLPLPSLQPPPPNFTLRRITESYKYRVHETLVGKGRSHHQGGEAAQNIEDAQFGQPAKKKVPIPIHMKPLAATVREHEGIAHMLQYLLLFGGGNQRDDLAPSDLTAQTAKQIGELFQLLDTNADGKLSIHDFHDAATIFQMKYNPFCFRKYDKNRSGFCDRNDVLRILFPHYSIKKIASIEKKLSRPQPKPLTTREMLNPKDVEEIDSMYDMYNALPNGGCTLNNMLSTMSYHMRLHASEVEALFTRFDQNSDGLLTREEYTEMVKYNYPPFKVEEGFLEKPTTNLKTTVFQKFTNRPSEEPVLTVDQVAVAGGSDRETQRPVAPSPLSLLASGGKQGVEGSPHTARAQGSRKSFRASGAQTARRGSSSLPSASPPRDSIVAHAISNKSSSSGVPGAPSGSLEEDAHQERVRVVQRLVDVAEKPKVFFPDETAAAESDRRRQRGGGGDARRRKRKGGGTAALVVSQCRGGYGANELQGVFEARERSKIQTTYRDHYDHLHQSEGVKERVETYAS